MSLLSFNSLRGQLIFLATLALVSACSRDSTIPLEPSGSLAAKASGSGPTVSSVNPAYGKQGTVSLDVRVYGSGFTQGSTATWERGGSADPKVTTNKTTYVSSGELVANITIAEDADLSLYDVAVTTSTGKKGIGMEMFEVTTAESIGTLGGNTLSRGINDAGHVVGYSVVSNVTHAFVWAPGAVMRSLGSGDAFDIDAAGNLVVGASGGNAVLWVRDSSGAWSPTQQLPNSGSGGAARGVASDAVGNAFLIVGSNKEAVKRSTTEYAAIWEKGSDGWIRKPRLPTPDGYYSWANEVNQKGQVVGAIRAISGSSSAQATVWEPSGGGYQRTTLLPIPGTDGSGAQAINSNGDVIVGLSGALPAYWQKTEAGWGAAQPLDAGSGNCSGGSQWAKAINDKGWIVGRTCNGTGWRATLWRGPHAPREDLGALGFGKDNSAANAINNAPTVVVGGNAQGSKTREGVIWQFPPLSQ